MPLVPATIEADIVVVGAGSAGCALAARLSAGPGLQVLVLEAGLAHGQRVAPSCCIGRAIERLGVGWRWG